MFGLGKNKKIRLYTEVLQNGYPVASNSYALTGGKRVVLGNRTWHSLFIPLYPFTGPLRLIRVKRGYALLDLPSGWKGYLTTSGEMKDIQPSTAKRRTFKIRKGDYGLICKDDLVILMRIAKERPPLKLRKSLIKVRASLFSLFFQNKGELNAILLAAALAILVFAPILGFLSQSNLSKPSSLVDLSLKWSLPYIHPDHFKNIPEAIQEDLKRHDYKKSTLNFIESLAAMYMDWSIPDRDVLFSESIERQKQLFLAQRERLEEIKQAQLQSERNLFKKPHTAVVNIPTVQGESVRGSIARIFDKLEIMHNSLTMALENRRKTIAEFKEDPEYDFENYKQGSMHQTKSGKEALSKISPFSMLSNEETMYSTAKDLGEQALLAQRHIFIHSTEKEHLFDPDLLPIGIPTDFPGLSFLASERFDNLDPKIDAIMASAFAGPKLLEHKEPLIGEIEPALIEKTIVKRQYELQLCYELALRRNREAQGKMEWGWRIDSFGSISELALLSSTIDDKNMEACIRSRIAAWNFPRPRRGSVEIRYPFEFRKDNG